MATIFYTARQLIDETFAVFDKIRQGVCVRTVEATINDFAFLPLKVLRGGRGLVSSGIAPATIEAVIEMMRSGNHLGAIAVLAESICMASGLEAEWLRVLGARAMFGSDPESARECMLVIVEVLRHTEIDTAPWISEALADGVIYARACGAVSLSDSFAKRLMARH